MLTFDWSYTKSTGQEPLPKILVDFQDLNEVSGLY